MAERICPACSAVVPPRLKFCRECGGRVDDAPAAAEPAPSDGGDATMVASLPRKSAPAPAPAAAAGGDKTVIGAFTVRTAEPEPVTMAPQREPEAPTIQPNMEMEAPTI